MKLSTTNNQQSAIRLSNISKKYILHHQKPTLIESFFKKRGKFWALRDINLTIKKGEKLGIIGPNGAGKTTLLNIICGITTPTTGKAETSGRIVSLIEPTAGFHPDLTGEENIYINGFLSGMTKKVIKEKFKEIVDFSGLCRFIDTPFYTYSAGMMFRLGLSIAIHSNPDILIVDEIFNTADKFFQESYKKRIQDFFKEKTAIFASHNLTSITQFCSRIVWLQKGKIKMIGKTKKVVELYKNQESP